MDENKKPWRSHQGKGLPKVAKHHRWKFINVGPALCGEHRNYRCHDCSLEVSVLIETSTIHRLQRPTRYHCKINDLEPDCAVQIVKKVLES